MKPDDFPVSGIEVDETWQVVFPARLHDAEIASVHQDRDRIVVIFEIEEPGTKPKTLRLECKGIRHFFYETRWVQNVLLEAFVFRWRDLAQAGVSFFHPDDTMIGEIRAILNRLPANSEASRSSVVFYAIPCGENDILIHCESITATLLDEVHHDGPLADQI